MPEKSVLFASEAGWALKNLPAPLNTWQARSESAASISDLNTRNSYSTLHAHITKAIISRASGNGGEIATVRVGNGHYASEATISDGSGNVVIAKLSANGKLSAAIVTSTGRYTQLPTLGNKGEDFDLSPILALVLAQLEEVHQETKDALETVVNEYGLPGQWNSPHLLYKLSDAVYYAIITDLVKCTITAGNIDLLTEQTVASGALNGNVLCGRPKHLAGKMNSSKKRNKMTMIDAKSEFTEWAQKYDWSDDEYALIPHFPDDYPIPHEALKIARRFVNTYGDKRPMKNFMWRATTSYGKSTGVEMVAAMLNMPLLRITCNSAMETQAFLSDILPENNSENITYNLPSFEEMSLDPETAYLTLTGISDENATSEMCLLAYTEKCTKASGTVRYKHVESNFVKALRHGYIVEVQECSRIKDSGVLVGLNEFNRPGSIIPLVDGSFATRHPDAMTIFTDNTGYASCRQIDPSVLRRMAFIIDSPELSKEDVMSRVLYNTNFPDKDLLEIMYKTWVAVREHCADREINEGSVTVNEIEMWCQTVMADGMGDIYENCLDCVVSKASSDNDEREEIISSVLTVHLADYVTIV